jgi:hypothetical protein
LDLVWTGRGLGRGEGERRGPQRVMSLAIERADRLQERKARAKFQEESNQQNALHLLVHVATKYE